MLDNNIFIERIPFDREVKDCLLIAARMYGVKTPDLLPPELYTDISDIDELCRLDGGILRSRQVIASIVQQYKKDDILNSPSGLTETDSLDDCFRRADSLSDPDGSCYSGLLVNNKDLRRIVLLVKEVRRLREKLKELK